MNSQLEKANSQLKALKISVQQHGDQLHLQATLPPKPTGQNLSDMDRAIQKWKQQKIYLGLKANPEGLRLAEAKSREISGLLLQNAFDWLDYWKPTEVKSSLPTVADWVTKAKEEFFSDRDSPSLRRTWRGHHEMDYKHLPQDRELSEQILIDCLKLQGAETRSREIYYKALTRLTKIAGFDCDLSKYKGTYSPTELNSNIFIQ
jgi:hypothetical protein